MTLLYNDKVAKDRIIELETPKFGLEGRFMVQLIRKVGDKEIILRELPWQKNIIVNSGLDEFFTKTINSAGGCLAFCAVGTGSTAPAATDVGLVAETGVRVNTDGGIVDASGWAAVNEYAFFRRTRLFTETQSNGNLTEFGFFDLGAAGTMFSRQLFKDGGGVPTTIIKTAADQLRLTYEIRLYPPTVDTAGNIVISGTNYAYTGRALGVGTGSWGNVIGGSILKSNLETSSASQVYETQVLAAATAIPSALGAATNASTSVCAVYVNGDFHSDVTQKWEPGVANYPTGIGISVLDNLFQTSWNPKFTKDNTKRLTLVTRIAWARH